MPKPGLGGGWGSPGVLSAPGLGTVGGPPLIVSAAEDQLNQQNKMINQFNQQHKMMNAWLTSTTGACRNMEDTTGLDLELTAGQTNLRQSNVVSKGSQQYCREDNTNH